MCSSFCHARHLSFNVFADSVPFTATINLGESFRVAERALSNLENIFLWGVRSAKNL